MQRLYDVFISVSFSRQTGERPRADENIARVPLPKSDPVYGTDGLLMNEWGLR